MVNVDFHIHTHLSSCADREAFITDYINTAKELGIEKIGFADHSWDVNACTPSSWYQGQTYERLQPRYDELKEIDTRGIDILLGAEGEYAKEVLCITEDALQYTDYIIVPHSHTHMTGVVLPSVYANDSQKHGQYLVNSFISLCTHEKRNFFNAIAHPMYPIGKRIDEAEEIYSYITDEMLTDCALAAKDADIPLEFNLTVTRNIMLSAEGKTCYHRFINICKKAGCKFFLGSDAHSIEVFKILHEEKNSVMQYFGMTEEDFIPLSPNK